MDRWEAGRQAAEELLWQKEEKDQKVRFADSVLSMLQFPPLQNGDTISP